MQFIDHTGGVQIETSVLQFARKIAKAKGDRCEVVEVGDGELFFHKDIPGWSKLYGLGLTGEVEPAQIERVEALFEEHHLDGTIAATPWHDSTLFKIAGERGWYVNDWGNMLIHDMKELPHVEPVSRDITLSPVQEEDIHLWAETISQGFADGSELSEDDTTLHLKLAEVEGVQCFLAFVRGKVAGASAMVEMPKEELVSIMSASTLPEFRRQGIHQAMIQHRLALAKEKGYKLALYVCLPGGDSQRNAERAGFRVAYSRMLLRKSLI